MIWTVVAICYLCVAHDVDGFKKKKAERCDNEFVQPDASIGCEGYYDRKRRRNSDGKVKWIGEVRRAKNWGPYTAISLWTK